MAQFMNKCKHCGKDTQNPKFCRRSCSASFNNKGVRRHGVVEYNKKCLWCDDDVNNGVKYCKGHQKIYNYHVYLNKWKLGLVDGCKGIGLNEHIRTYMFKKNGSKCQKCYWNEINPVTVNVPLEVHHIDGDYTNNDECNLELLCPNCHSITPTYKSLNNGNGRKRAS